MFLQGASSFDDHILLTVSILHHQVSVYDYIWDEDDLGTNTHREVTTHIAIHTLHLDGLRELYRHFLCLPGKQQITKLLNFSFILDEVTKLAKIQYILQTVQLLKCLVSLVQLI